MRVLRPAEPPQRGWQDNGAQDHGRQSVLGRQRTGYRPPLLVPGEGEQREASPGGENAKDHGDEGEFRYGGRPSATLETERDGLVREVQDAIYEREVGGQEHEDGFLDDYAHGLGQVLVHQRLEVDGRFLELCPEGKIARREAQAFGLAREQHGLKGFVDGEEADKADQAAVDEGEPGCPSPPDAVHDKAAEDGCKSGAEVDACCGEGKRDASADGMPDVDKHAAHDGEDGAAKHALEEAADEDGAHISGQRLWDLEDSQARQSGPQWYRTPKHLGHGSEDERSACESGNVQ